MHRKSTVLLVAIILLFSLAQSAHAASELVGYWKFDESSGNAIDSSGNLPDLTNNNVTYGEGRYGNAAYFDGSTSFFSGTGPNLSGASFTFSAWLWRESAGGDQQIYFSLGSDGNTDKNLHLRVYTNGQMRFGFRNDDIDAPVGTFVMGQWNHVVLTYDATTNTRKIYLNGGEAKASGTAGGDFTGNTDLTVGNWGANGQYWNGRVDDLKIYNRALTLDEVEELAEGGAGPGLLDVDSFSPTSGATGVPLNPTLVATFSASTIATSTGDIGIYKASDDSLVESIDLSDPNISISGGVVTIVPNVTLDNSTEYYVSIPSTAFKDADNTFYAGTASSTWTFTTVADAAAPTISNITASTTSTGATIAWDTDENASTKVVYSVDEQYASSTAETDTADRKEEHSTTLHNLLPCTYYNYKAVSADAAGNYATSSAETFYTNGCSGDATPFGYLASSIETNTENLTQYSSGGRALSIRTPENFTAASSSVVIHIVALPTDTALAPIGVPSGNFTSVGQRVYDIKALLDNETELDSFDTPLTISYMYSLDDVDGVDLSKLWLYHYHGGEWLPLDSCVLYEDQRYISCSTPSFSMFALFASSTPAQSQNVTDATRARRTSGSSIQNQVANLIAMGNTAQADALKKQWYWLFSGTVSGASSAASTALPVRDLTVGMTGNDVRALQQLLNANGALLATNGVGSPGNETAYFGSLTQAALAAYQAANGILPTAGYFGTITRAQMKAAGLPGLWW